MTENEIISQLGGNGVAVLAIGWVISRLTALERRLDALTAHFGIDVPRRRRWKKAAPPLLLLALLLLIHLATGCAVITQRVSDTATNGLSRVTVNRAVVFGDARNTVDKLRVSNGKTHSIGVDGEKQESAATNAATALREVRTILELLR